VPLPHLAVSPYTMRSGQQVTNDDAVSVVVAAVPCLPVRTAPARALHPKRINASPNGSLEDAALKVGVRIWMGLDGGAVVIKQPTACGYRFHDGRRVRLTPTYGDHQQAAPTHHPTISASPTATPCIHPPRAATLCMPTPAAIATPPVAPWSPPAVSEPSGLAPGARRVVDGRRGDSWK